MIPHKHFLLTSSIAVNVLHVSPEAHSTSQLFIEHTVAHHFPFNPCPLSIPLLRHLTEKCFLIVYWYTCIGFALIELVPVDLRRRTCLS